MWQAKGSAGALTPGFVIWPGPRPSEPKRAVGAPGAVGAGLWWVPECPDKGGLQYGRIVDCEESKPTMSPNACSAFGDPLMTEPTG